MTATCPNGHETADARFCPECGSPVVVSNPAVCPEGHENPKGAKFCVECGTTLAPPVEEEVTCPNGHVNPGTATFCMTCGTAVSRAGAAPLVRAETESRAPESKSRGRSLAVVALAASIALLAGGVVGWWFLLRDDGGQATAEDSAASAASSGSTAQDTFTVRGSLTLFDDLNFAAGYEHVYDHCYFGTKCHFPAHKPCVSRNTGYSDIAMGAPVTVTDSSGEVIALGSLNDGTTPFIPNVFKHDAPPCRFTFTVEDVPESGDIYGVEVSRRGSVSFTRSESESLTISLGD